MSGTIFGWPTAAATPAAATAPGNAPSLSRTSPPGDGDHPLGHGPIAGSAQRFPCIAPYTAGRISRERFAAEVKCPKQVSGGVWIV